jgi:sphingomyelin phosphodiesterase
LEVESFYYNLTAANLNPSPSGKPEWQTLYSLKKDFGLADLSPASLNGLTTRLAQEPELLKKHWSNTVKLGDKSLEQGCNKACKKFILCDIVINEMEDNRKCAQLLEIFKN